ncbi:DUF4229 domain-containing protein [Yinghuangia soli]|uniref:DUF4229 domain-containing protein n=1 Tax=Yinghuangia soli TaxID=2908204 RepID=A0AA41U080_9ACTN|nr:DUF4229 domain-containing protein [Yinghuangia soli]MCF2529528.1 DUF4229 domain-containing protein [Yinghuangia soli]
MSTTNSAPQSESPSEFPSASAPDRLGPAEPAAAPAGASTGHPALRYTLLRFGLFAVVGAVVWLVFVLLDVAGSGGAFVAIAGISLAISGLISYFALNGQRDAMSAALVERVERAKARIDEGAAAEDRAVELGNSPRTAEPS